MRILASLHKKIRCIYLLTACMVVPASTVYTAFIEVTSEADSGPGTLRQAIIDANISGDTIAFAPQVTLIKLFSPLPIITNGYTIDALSTVVNGQLIPSNCDSLPSPVGNPEEFSVTLRVTIDGSAIPSSTPFSGFGLRTTSNPTILGLKIQNFTGSSESPDAIGIQGVLGTALPTIMCCEITALLSGPTQITSGSASITTNGNAIGIDRAGTIQRCLIRNIRTPSLMNPEAGTVPVLATGNAIGINNFELIHECNVTTICGGDIFANNTQSDYTFLLGQTMGCNFAADSPAFTTPTIQSSVIHDIHGGSICTNYSDSTILPVNDTALFDTILLFNTCGVCTDSSEKVITIHDTRVCNIQTGAIQICNDTVTAITPFAAGLFVRGAETTLTNNTVSHISGNHVRISGNNSSAFISTAAGIISSAPQSAATANTISHITAGASCIDGECSYLFSQPLFTFTVNDLQYVLPPAVGFLSFDDSNLLSNTAQLHNTHITNIDASNHSARGMNSNIVAAGAVGAALLLSIESSTEQNTIKKITGPALTASAAALIVRNLQGSAGLQLLSPIVETHNNTIQEICEGVARTSGSTPTINAFISNPEDDDRNIFNTFTSGIYMDGLAFQISNPSSPIMNARNNTVKDIRGAHTQSHGARQGSIAAGIFLRRPNTINLNHSAVQLKANHIANPLLPPEWKAYTPPPSVTSVVRAIPERCPDIRIGTIEQNSIATITGGTHAPGFGILFNQDAYLLSLEELSFSSANNNTISNVTGGVLAPYTLTKQEIVAECITGSEGDEIITILPLFPYGPSAGISLFASGCASVEGNVIQKISSPDNKARGIGTVASSDVEIKNNAIRTITGPGIFVGGASADCMLITQAGLTSEEFEEIFPSVRNKIFNNSTQADMTQGIELGTVNWDDFLISMSVFLSQVKTPGAPTMPRLTIIGNHDQVAAHIDTVICNSNGTITIDITFSDPRHPNSTFIIQFFRNSTNTVPHGEQYISPFTTDFSFTTDENGNARTRFVFVPAHKVKTGDSISAHVTLIMDGTIGTAGSEVSPDNGDTSEFAVHQSGKQSQIASVVSCSNTPSGYPRFNTILSCKT